jgi:tetratricopeptide (TPR) repeat protein/2-polyprenyl-3-methyl-5-hydroxy-6-metoxy-1,4-benzoquinol methylase
VGPVGARESRKLAQKLVERGVAADRSGDAAKAIELFRKAAEVDERYAPAHMNFGSALRAMGESAAAIAAGERAIGLEPEYVAAHYNLGLAHLSCSQYLEAERVFQIALRLRNRFPEAWVGLADALVGLGRNEEALSALDEAVAQGDDYVGALVKSFVLLQKLGRVEQAMPVAQRVLELEPDNFLAHATLGLALQRLGQLSEAEASYRRAVTFGPDYAEAKVGLASLLDATGRAQEAIPLHFDLVANDPGNVRLRRNLAEALNGIALTKAAEQGRSVLVSLCQDNNLFNFIVPSIIGLTHSDTGFQTLLESARRGDHSEATLGPAVGAFLSDPLLPAALPRMVITDAALEEALTHLRRRILLSIKPASGNWSVDSDVPKEFACALARQCFYSGYAFSVGDMELERIASLRSTLQDAVRGGIVEARALEPLLTIAALYDSLNTLEGCERLLEYPQSDWSDSFRPMVQEQIANRAREREIARQITSITSIEDEVSKAVRAQYEENPYPRWVALETPEPITIERLLHRLVPNQEVRIRPRPVPVLIAGCGTGRQPISFAMAFPDSEILAVDLSVASLSYAARMSEERGLSNITYRQADILKLGGWDRRFAIVECFGVLHHLKDPLAGWRILLNLLEPDGLMRIALYSKTARRGIQAAREFVKSHKFPPTPEGIRRCRDAIMRLPEGHLARSAMRSGDFFVTDGCRDLIMHVQEHQFTIPQIEECLEELGLRFLAFECPPATRKSFTQMFPDPAAESRLEAWHQFEEAYPDTFDRTYSFWLCRK